MNFCGFDTQGNKLQKDLKMDANAQDTYYLCLASGRGSNNPPRAGLVRLLVFGVSMWFSSKFLVFD